MGDAVGLERALQHVAYVFLPDQVGEYLGPVFKSQRALGHEPGRPFGPASWSRLPSHHVAGPARGRARWISGTPEESLTAATFRS